MGPPPAPASPHWARYAQHRQWCHWAGVEYGVIPAWALLLITHGGRLWWPGKWTDCSMTLPHIWAPAGAWSQHLALGPALY